MPHRQPLKTLFFLYFALKLGLFKLPYIALKTLLFPSTKPFRSWSFREWLTICFLREYLEIVASLHLGHFPIGVEVPDGTFKDCKFVRLGHGGDGAGAGGKLEGVREPLKSYAEKAGVERDDTLSGFWYFRKGSESARLKHVERAGVDEKVVYCIHGGGFFHGSAYPTDIYALIPKGIVQHSKTISRAFSIDYRLCSSAPFKVQHPFPAAVLDAVDGYRYVLSLGFKPENVILVGDSAGGNLALALMRYLREEKTEPAADDMSVPGRVVLLSPWADMTSSRAYDADSSYARNHVYDMFHRASEFILYAQRSYLGKTWPMDQARRNPYIASITADNIQSAARGSAGEYAGYPKTLIIVGDVDLSKDDSIILAEILKKDNDEEDEGRITLYRVPEGIHDVLIFDFTGSRHTETMKRMVKWIDE